MKVKRDKEIVGGTVKRFAVHYIRKGSVEVVSAGWHECIQYAMTERDEIYELPEVKEVWIERVEMTRLNRTRRCKVDNHLQVVR